MTTMLQEPAVVQSDQGQNPHQLVKNQLEALMTQGDRIEKAKVRLYSMARQPYEIRNVQAIQEYIQELLAAFEPSMHLYNVLLNTRIMLNDVNGIHELMKLIQKHGLKFNVFTYNLLIAYYRNSACPEEAERLAEQMQACGLQPNRYTFTTLITAFGKKNISKSQSYFEKMKASINPADLPDIYAYNAMIGAYMYHFDFKSADSLVQEMGIVGIAPNFVTYKILIEGLLKGKRRAEAWQIFEAALPELEKSRDISMADFSEICSAFWASGCSQEALKILCRMEKSFEKIHSRCVAPALFFSISIEDSELFLRLLKRHVLPNAHDYRVVIPKLLAKSQEAPMTLDVINALEEASNLVCSVNLSK